MRTLIISLLIMLATQAFSHHELANRNIENGHDNYKKNCASCHGETGRGDGPLAKNLPQSPTDLTQLSKRNGGKYPAARTLSYIYGDPKKSHLARVMPEFSSAMSEDLVPVEIDGVFTPTPPELAGLLAYLESIQE